VQIVFILTSRTWFYYETAVVLLFILVVQFIYLLFCDRFSSCSVYIISFFFIFYGFLHTRACTHRDVYIFQL